MSLVEIILIAVSLAMDAFAVSVTAGCMIKESRIKSALLMSTSFGFFQVMMPVIGWLAGTGFLKFISSWDHWIAFGLLLFIGSKMIYEALKKDEKGHCINPFRFVELLMLSIATSIDALAVGISFSCLNINIVLPVILIGIITFIVSFSGFFIGKTAGHFLGNKVEIFGGLILVGIGVKILIEHIY